MRQLITISALLSFLTAQQVHPKYGIEGIPEKFWLNKEIQNQELNNLNFIWLILMEMDGMVQV